MSSMSSSSEDTESDSDSSSDSTSSSSSAEGTYDGKVARTFKKPQHLKNRHGMSERGRPMSKPSLDRHHRFVYCSGMFYSSFLVSDVVEGRVKQKFECLTKRLSHLHDWVTGIMTNHMANSIFMEFV